MKGAIVEEYVNGTSMNQLSKKYGINIGSVSRILDKAGVPRRNLSEGVNGSLTEKDSLTLSDNNRQLVIGNLLGDGSVGMKSRNKRAYYSHVDKHEEYLKWLQSELARDGVTFSPIYQTSSCYALQSHTYAVFNEFRERFYPEGQRIVPKDIELTPIALRQWYISDGSLATYGGRYIAKKLGDPEPLLLKFHELFRGVTYHYDGKFYIPKRSVGDFLDYIGGPPVECYRYKWC